ncbi:MAG: hypothetical protein RPS47_01710, partial [Colwellia sp.]
KEEELEIEGKKLKISVTPARVKDSKTGKYLDYLPGLKEQKILKTLIKIASEESSDASFYGNSVSPYLVVTTTYHAIQKVIGLSSGKNKYNKGQIAKAIKILQNTNVTILDEQGIEISAPLLSSVVTLGKDLDDIKNNKALCIGLSPIFSKSIALGSFRLYNYQKDMESPDLLTSYLYSKLVHKFTYASNNREYSFMASSLLLEFPTLKKWKRFDKVLTKIEEAIKNLSSTVSKYEIDNRYLENGTSRKKLIDAKITIWGTDEFIKEQIISNAKKEKSVIDTQTLLEIKRPEQPENGSEKEFESYIKEAEEYNKNKDSIKATNIINNIFKE